MSQFFALFEQNSTRAEPSSDAHWADREFPRVVEQSPLRMWQPGDAIQRHGVRLLVGIATWSGYDMRLLDVVANSLRRTNANQPLVEVFNTADCLKPSDLKDYIPRLHQVFHTPVAGIWQDGQLVWSGEGYEAREQVARRFHTGSAEIVAFVQDWMKLRAQKGGS